MLKNNNNLEQTIFKKYLNYKKKYLGLKSKFIGGDIIHGEAQLPIEIIQDLRIEDLMLLKKNLTIDQFLELDKIDDYDRRIGIVINTGIIVLIPLYISSYNYNLNESNYDVYYECYDQPNKPDGTDYYANALEIRNTNIKGKPLYKMGNLSGTIYLDLDSLIYIRDNVDTKYWLFTFDKKINRVVNRKYVYKPKLNAKGLPTGNMENLNGTLVNTSIESSEGSGRTKCIKDSYDYYNVQKVNLIPKVVEHVEESKSEDPSKLQESKSEEPSKLQESKDTDYPIEYLESTYRKSKNDKIKDVILRLILKNSKNNLDPEEYKKIINSFFRVNPQRLIIRKESDPGFVNIVKDVIEFGKRL